MGQTKGGIQLKAAFCYFVSLNRSGINRSFQGRIGGRIFCFPTEYSSRFRMCERDGRIPAKPSDRKHRDLVENLGVRTCKPWLVFLNIVRDISCCVLNLFYLILLLLILIFFLCFFLSFLSFFSFFSFLFFLLRAERRPRTMRRILEKEFRKRVPEESWKMLRDAREGFTRRAGESHWGPRESRKVLKEWKESLKNGSYDEDPG